MVKINSSASNYHIRRAELSDAELLADLGRQSFYEAFASQTDPQDMAAHLQTAFNINAINTELKGDRSLFFIIGIESSPAGYAYLQPKMSPDCVKNSDSIQLIRFYLRRDYYGRGIGNALMSACLKEAKAQGYRSIWLSSWEFNTRANSFYKKWRFKVAGRQKFTVGSDVQTDYIFTREI